jgi:hypothetical protein
MTTRQQYWLPAQRLAGRSEYLPGKAPMDDDKAGWSWATVTLPDGRKVRVQTRSEAIGAPGMTLEDTAGLLMLQAAAVFDKNFSGRWAEGMQALVKAIERHVAEGGEDRLTGKPPAGTT